MTFRGEEERQSEREGKSFGFGREQSGVRDDEGGGVMLLWLLFPTGGRCINTSSLFTITYYIKNLPIQGGFFRAKPMWNYRCFARETRAKQ